MKHQRRTSRPGKQVAPGRRSLLALAAAILLWPTGASAAPFVDVTYDLGDSTAFSNIQNIVTTTVPPDGTISGTQTIRYTGTSGSGFGTGPAKLLSFNLYVQATPQMNGFTPSGAQTLVDLATSDLHFELIGTVGATAGSLLAGGTVTAAGASGIFRVTGYMHCLYQPQCQFLKHPYSTRISIVPWTFTAPFPTLTGAVGQPHTLQGTATGISFKLRPNTPDAVGLNIVGTTFLVGREVQRAHVPEPGTLPLAALGLLGLGLAAAGRSHLIRRRPTLGTRSG